MPGVSRPRLPVLRAAYADSLQLTDFFYNSLVKRNSASPRRPAPRGPC
jgi:hypothetical protein